MVISLRRIAFNSFSSCLLSQTHRKEIAIKETKFESETHPRLLRIAADNQVQFFSHKNKQLTGFYSNKI